MENNYRTPTIEELMTDGFEYEVRTKTKGEKLGSFGIVDLAKDNFEDQMKPIYAKEDEWYEQTKVTLPNIVDDMWNNPYQQRDCLLKRLEQGNVRTKIK